MKTIHFTILFASTLCLLVGNAWSRPVDLSAPGDQLGASDAHGNLEIWRENGEVGINFGPGSYLPLRYKFSSDNSTRGVLGPGFYCPMLEAKNVLIREQMMTASLPCGKVLYLRREPTDQNKFQTVDQVWTGYRQGNDDFIAWRDDGWSIAYRHGRLTSITTDEHHEFTWDYDGNTHMATVISKDGQPLLTVEPNQQGLVGTLVFNAKRYELGYTERPLMEMLQAQPVIKQLAVALSSFRYPNGRTETFQFGLTPERIPTVTFTDPEKKQTVYTWDVATGHIATEQGPDGNWTYNVGNVTQAFGLPPISRTGPDGTSESIDLNNALGITKIKSADGSTITTTAFRTSGPLYGKVKEITRTVNGQSSVLYRYSYNEKGWLVRTVDVNGFTTMFTYGKDGTFVSRHVAPPSDPSFVAAHEAKEKILLDKVLSATDPTFALQQLAFFYIYQMGDISKAAALLPKVSDSLATFNINLHIIVGDPNLPNIQKAEKLKDLLKKYPDQKLTVSNLINIYEGENRQPSNPQKT